MTSNQAMRIWQNLSGDYEVSCCKGSHEYYSNSKSQIVFKPDHLVCDRERAWRRYVRLRDNNPDFPFNNTFIFGDEN